MQIECKFVVDFHLFMLIISEKIHIQKRKKISITWILCGKIAQKFNRDDAWVDNLHSAKDDNICYKKYTCQKYNLDWKGSENFFSLKRYPIRIISLVQEQS